MLSDPPSLRPDRTRGAARGGERAREATSHRVVRNGALYFASMAAPALLAVLLVPVTVHALGPARFGLLALAWAVAEGSQMFDFGLGRATVRFVADGIARASERVEEIVLASAYSQFAAGLVAGLLLYLLTPLLVWRVMAIAPAQRDEAVAMFRVLALHIPVLLGLSALRAALEGAQRFDLSTSLRMPSSLASLVIPAVAASRGASLATILWMLLAVRVALLILSAAAVRGALLRGRWAPPASWRPLRDMLKYSGWVAVSTVLGPALGSFDRFAVGSVAGVAALGYYTGAAEAATRFLLFPATAFAAMLPALAAAGAGGRERALAVTRAARRQLATVLYPLCLTLVAFAPLILGRWLGPAFTADAAQALRILAVGVFLTGIAHLPMALLYGSGRSDLPAKIHLVQVCVHVPLTLVLVRLWGIPGAAVAWTVRCAEDLVLYEWARGRALGRYPADAAERRRGFRLAGVALALLAAFALAVWLRARAPALALAVVVVALTAYAAAGWALVLGDAERAAWTAMLRRRAAPARA